MYKHLIDVKPAGENNKGSTIFFQRSKKIALINKMFRRGNILQNVKSKEIYTVEKVGTGFALLTPKSRVHVVVDFYRSIFPFFIYRTSVLKDWNMISERAG